MDIQASIRDLSENIARTARDKTITAGVDALNSMRKTHPEAHTEVLIAELTDYIQDTISAEFGRLIALMDTSETRVVVKHALQEGVMDIPVTELGVTLAAVKSLTELGFSTVGELIEAHPVDVMDAKGVGSRSLDNIKTYLHLRGIEWPGEITAEQIKERRYERLDMIALRDFSRGAISLRGYGGDKYKWMRVVSVKDLRTYLLSRLMKLPDEAIYPYELTTFIKLFNKLTVYELFSIGIKTFGDLLPLTKKELKFSKRTDQDAMLRDIAAGLALIGRELLD